MEAFDDQSDSDIALEAERLPALGDFLSHIGEWFAVCAPQGSLEIQLVEAKALPAQFGVAYEDAFSLVFKAAHDCVLIDGSVALDHENVGWVVLFLALIHEDENGRFFEAVFM
jgi:hypothetical protein